VFEHCQESPPFGNDLQIRLKENSVKKFMERFVMKQGMYPFNLFFLSGCIHRVIDVNLNMQPS